MMQQLTYYKGCRVYRFPVYCCNNGPFYTDTFCFWQECRIHPLPDYLKNVWGTRVTWEGPKKLHKLCNNNNNVAFNITLISIFELCSFFRKCEQKWVSPSCTTVPLGCEQDLQGSQDIWLVGSLMYVSSLQVSHFPYCRVLVQCSTR